MEDARSSLIHPVGMGMSCPWEGTGTQALLSESPNPTPQGGLAQGIVLKCCTDSSAGKFPLLSGLQFLEDALMHSSHTEHLMPLLHWRGEE